MRKTLLKCTAILSLASFLVQGVGQTIHTIYAESEVSTEREGEASDSEEKEEGVELEEEMEVLSYSEIFKTLSQEQKDFISYMTEKYDDYEFMFDVKSVNLDKEKLDEVLSSELSQEEYVDALYDFLGEENAYYNKYDDNEMYTETEEGLSIPEFLKQVLQEAIEDYQADKVYMMDKVKDINYVNEQTDTLDAMTTFYANEASITRLLVTRFTKANLEAEANYYKEVSKELDIELTPETDMSELDEETIEKIYASKAFEKTMDPEYNPDGQLSSNLDAAMKPDEWEKALEAIYNAEYTEELSGRDLNMLANTLNQLRITRSFYYDAIEDVLESVEEAEKEESVEKTEKEESVEEAEKEESVEKTEKEESVEKTEKEESAEKANDE